MHFKYYEYFRKVSTLEFLIAVGLRLLMFGDFSTHYTVASNLCQMLARDKRVSYSNPHLSCVRVFAASSKWLQCCTGCTSLNC